MRKYLYIIDFIGTNKRYEIIYQNNKFVYIIGENGIIKIKSEIIDSICNYSNIWYTYDKLEYFRDGSKYKENIKKINKKIYYIHYDKNEIHCEKRVAVIYDKINKVYYLKNKKNELDKINESDLENKINLKKILNYNSEKIKYKPIYVDNDNTFYEFFKNKNYYNIIIKCFEKNIQKIRFQEYIKYKELQIKAIQQEIETKINIFKKIKEKTEKPFIDKKDFEYINKNIENFSEYMLPFVKEDDDN